MEMNNIPEVKVGVVAVSRDCFPIELSRKRRIKVIEECKKKKIDVLEIKIIVENEKDVLKALSEIKQEKVNALVVYLGNFGPEGPLTLLAQKFDGPVMFVAASEDSGKDLMNGRGDAYCGLLSASYNIILRNLSPYIPEYPIGVPSEVADMIKEFVPVARIILGLKKLKVFTFGPRPQDFLACNAPIKPLYDMGIEVMENSELDLYDIYLSAKGSPEINAVAKDMEKELGKGGTSFDFLQRIAQFEVALTKFFETKLGASEYGVFANKCWPAFTKYFGFIPCYVNSRLASKGIPVACEVDIYGALSEYILLCATETPPTLLDINNTVPYDMYKSAKSKTKNYKPNDLFMGFHCGNTPSCCLVKPALKYSFILNRLMEQGKDPDISRGSIEGMLKPSGVTIYRLQSTDTGILKSYIAEGETLDVDPKTFGGTGIIAIKDMGRFYRHVLVEHGFPHHTAMTFKHTAKAVFSATKMLGVKDVFFNLSQGMYYKTENPF